MNQVGKGRVAKETLTRVYGVLEFANLLTHEVFHLLYLLAEVLHHLLVYLFVLDADNLALDDLLHQLALLVGQRDVSLGNVLYKAARIQTQHLFVGTVGYPVVVHLVVVSEEDEVEAWHLLGYSLRGVLLVLVSRDATVQS